MDPNAEQRWRELAPGVGLVATDLDGTLLRPDLTVSTYTVEVLARARAADLPVVFVTGRPPRWMQAVVEATGHAGVALCANGALVVDLRDNTVLEAHPLDGDVLAEVVASLRSEVPGVAFAIEFVPDSTRTPFAHEHGYRSKYPHGDAESGDDIVALVGDHAVVKLLARVVGSGHDADTFLDTALSHVDHLVTVTHSNADDVLLEMSGLGVSKGAALSAHAARLGVPASACAAAGDMPNDVPMLEWADVGLAVAGAHRSVLEAARAVIPGPEGDGVAQFVAAALDTRRP